MGKLFDDIEAAFSGFGWENALEIAVITFAIFWLLRLIRGTTAMTVVRGISILAAIVVVLSRALDSVVLDWIVNNAIAVIVIFVLIVFQPEFRRALERLGRTGGIRPWLGLGRDNTSAVVHDIARAGGALAARRHGALIVIERETGLQDVVDTGVALDAEVSVALLESIFFPSNPLHDGAAVLHGGRVLAASCILPTTDASVAGLEYLGTRHRAAIGISEQTDAVVVVVSEESGDVSIASDGRLLRLPDAEGLEANLLPLLAANGRGSGGNGRGSSSAGGSRTITVARS